MEKIKSSEVILKEALGEMRYKLNGTVTNAQLLWAMETYAVQFKAATREALANYMKSEGCMCCQDIVGHEEAAEALGEILDVPKYSDASGYDFLQFATDTNAR
jgi:hypothetical protein